MRVELDGILRGADVPHADTLVDRASQYVLPMERRPVKAADSALVALQSALQTPYGTRVLTVVDIAYDHRLASLYAHALGAVC